MLSRFTVAVVVALVVVELAPAQGCYGGAPQAYSPPPGWRLVPAYSNGFGNGGPSAYSVPSAAYQAPSCALPPIRPIIVSESRSWSPPSWSPGNGVRLDLDSRRNGRQTRVRLETGMAAPGGGRYVCGPDGCYIVR